MSAKAETTKRGAASSLFELGRYENCVLAQRAISDGDFFAETLDSSGKNVLVRASSRES